MKKEGEKTNTPSNSKVTNSFEWTTNTIQI